MSLVVHFFGTQCSYIHTPKNEILGTPLSINHHLLVYKKHYKTNENAAVEHDHSKTH